MMDTRTVNVRVRLHSGRVTVALAFLGHYWQGLDDITAQVAEVLS